MFINISVLLIAFVINRASSSDSSSYSIPDPKIEIFKKGFRLSIAHEEGVALFAFHGNINIPMYGLEAGQFSKDIVKKCGKHWVFEDKNARLFVGDTIYFWLFVIKERLGYRLDDGHFVVKEISEYEPLACHQLHPTPPVRKNDSDIWHFEVESTSRHTPTPNLIHTSSPPVMSTTPKKKQDEEPEVCCDLFLNVSYRIISMAEENKKLLDENRVLYDLAEKNGGDRTLKIMGKYPEKYYPTPRQFAQNLIKEKLFIEDVKVTEGESIPGGISFKVETLKDKVRVILASKKGLRGSNYELTW